MFTVKQQTTTTGTEPSDTTTGAVLRAMREGAGMSQRALAEGAECSHQHLAYIEQGQRPLSHDLAHRVAVAIANQYSPVAA